VDQTSGSSWQHRRVETLELDAGISSGEAPVDIVLLDIAVVPPSADLVNQRVAIGNALV
jgi:hypothetical protein